MNPDAGSRHQPHTGLSGGVIRGTARITGVRGNLAYALACRDGAAEFEGGLGILLTGLAATLSLPAEPGRRKPRGVTVPAQPDPGTLP